MSRRRAMMMPKGGGGILPAEYQQVEYIKFADNARIDTGINEVGPKVN